MDAGARIAELVVLMIAESNEPKNKICIGSSVCWITIGAGGRLKLTKSIALTCEYYYRLNVPEDNPYYNSLGFGIDIETGGHVFQLVMTNTRGLTERSFITETEGDFADGDIHLGFNVTRTFQLKRTKQ